MVGVLTSHQCGPVSIMAWFHMWVEFVVGSRHALRSFHRVLLFSSLHKKPTSTNSSSTRIKDQFFLPKLVSLKEKEP